MAVKRVLFLAAEPTDAGRLRLGQEQRDIRTALRLSSHRDSIEVTERFAVRPGDLTQALHDVQPHIVHFSGHGTSNGALCFEDDSGALKAVEPDALAEVFALFTPGIECVLLNACYSAKQAHGIGKTINYVMGMSKSIGDKSAITFAVGFYKALGSGRDYPDAFRLGVAEMRISDSAGPATPVLHERMGGPLHFVNDVAIAGPEHATFELEVDWRASHRPAIHVKISEFGHLRRLLDMLYMEYLSNRVPPSTYGSRWIIAGGRNRNLLVAPPQWVREPASPIHAHSPDWADVTDPARLGLTEGTSWRIRLREDDAPLVEAAYAVQSDDPTMRTILSTYAKAFVLGRSRFSRVRSEDAFDASTPFSPMVFQKWLSLERGNRYYVDRGGEIPTGLRYYADH